VKIKGDAECSELLRNETMFAGAQVQLTAFEQLCKAIGIVRIKQQCWIKQQRFTLIYEQLDN